MALFRRAGGRHFMPVWCALFGFRNTLRFFGRFGNGLSTMTMEPMIQQLADELLNKHQMHGMNSDSRWYALAVRSNSEKHAAAGLQQNKIENFLPLYRSRRVWSDRIKELDLPLFPGYVFARFALPHKVPVLRSPYVTSIVGFGNGPAPVPDQQIDQIRILVASKLPVSPWPFLEADQRVAITAGALRGIEGILIEVKSSWRVVVKIPLLQRAVATTIDRAYVSPVGNCVMVSRPPADAVLQESASLSLTSG